MKRQVCRNYASKGTCEFGKNCRFLHLIETPLLDPPNWIFSHFKEMQEFSPEEVRAFYYDSKMTNKEAEFANEHDRIWMTNYKILCDELNMLEENGEIVSDSDRTCDVRITPGVFNKMFYPERLGIASIKSEEPMIIEEKKAFVPYARESDGRGNRKEEGYARRYDVRKYDNEKEYVKGRDSYANTRGDFYKDKEYTNTRGDFARDDHRGYDKSRKYDDYRGFDKGRKYESDKPLWNNDNYRGYDKGRHSDSFNRRNGDDHKERTFDKPKFAYTPTNKFEDRNNFGRGQNQVENVVYDKYGNIVEKNRNKKNLDSLFEDDRTNTYFKK